MKGYIRWAFLFGFPILLGANAVYRVGSEVCAVPCIKVITAPINQAILLGDQFAGWMGMVGMVLLIAFWIVNFVGRLTRVTPI